MHGERRTATKRGLTALNESPSVKGGLHLPTNQKILTLKTHSSKISTAKIKVLAFEGTKYMNGN